MHTTLPRLIQRTQNVCEANITLPFPVTHAKYSQTHIHRLKLYSHRPAPVSRSLGLLQRTGISWPTGCLQEACECVCLTVIALHYVALKVFKCGHMSSICFIKLFECFCFSCFLVLLMCVTECNCCLRGIDLRVGGAVLHSWGIRIKNVLCFHRKKLIWYTSLWSCYLCLFCGVLLICSRAPQLPRYMQGEDNYLLVRERLGVIPPYRRCMKIKCLSFSQTVSLLFSQGK